AALAGLASRLTEWSFRFIDCQVHTEHMASLGAEGLTRDAFLEELERALEPPTRRGSWDQEPPAQASSPDST
ncbi:MAG: leucyl/phenylalanyl-tRNA--protein transferase, partial [Acidobacteriota bacterium]